MQAHPGAPTTVLLVDDDVALTDLLSFALAREGFAVRVAHRGAQALRLVRDGPPDLVLLDVNLPDADGFALCAQIRAAARIPVVLLTARHLADEMVAGFRQGADDYVTKPFDVRVLCCRLRALLRRCGAGAAPPEAAGRAHRVGDGTFDGGCNELRRGAASARLTPVEGRLLRLLLAHEGQVLAPERILERVWGYDTECEVAVVKTHIRRLRLKLAAVFGEQPLVHTVPGAGYCYRAPAPMHAALTEARGARARPRPGPRRGGCRP